MVLVVLHAGSVLEYRSTFLVKSSVRWSEAASGNWIFNRSSLDLQSAESPKEVCHPPEERQRLRRIAGPC